MLKLDSVSTHYGAIQALDQVSVDVNQGEIVTLIGANGAGKTTLLMTVCGSPRATAGSISFMGEDITKADTHRIMRKGIAISPEGRRVFPRLDRIGKSEDGRFLFEPQRDRRRGGARL